jgi:hypothetical protein
LGAAFGRTTTTTNKTTTINKLTVKSTFLLGYGRRPFQPTNVGAKKQGYGLRSYIYLFIGFVICSCLSTVGFGLFC